MIGYEHLVEESESHTQTPVPPKYKVYWTRWYILLVYSFAGLMQGYLWNMWGPIYHSVTSLWGWGTMQMALFPFYGTLVFALLVLPSTWMLEKIGLRRTVLLMTFLVLLGTFVRCFPANETITTVLANVSALVNGLPGIVTFYLPAYISARWFPLHERKLATAIGTLLNTIGLALSFLLGPLFVPQPSNSTTHNKEDMREGYFQYTWMQTGVSLALFLLVLLHYPDQPPSPPSQSASVSRIDYWDGSLRLLKSKDFWMVIAPATCIFGSFSGWIPILSIDLQAQNVNEDHAGQIGFWTSIIGAIVGILAGMLGDYFGHLKAILMACCFIAAESSVWLVLIMRGFLPFSLNQAYVASILLGVAASALLPINFELAVEICYPVDEAIVVGLLGLICNIWCCVFLVILFFKSVGTVWVDWFLAVACVLGFLSTLPIREVYRRTAVDIAGREAENSQSEISSQSGPSEPDNSPIGINNTHSNRPVIVTPD